MVTFITGNPEKVRECERMLGVELAHETLPLEEIQALDVGSVVEHKARAAYATLQRPVLVEDTGLTFAAWNGLPGALIAWFLDSVGVHGVCRMLEGEANRAATATSVFAYYDAGGVRTFAGTVDGQVPNRPRGTRGFGWDAIFAPQGRGRTFAEMDAAEKDRWSMRRRALESLNASGLLAG